MAEASEKRMHPGEWLLLEGRVTVSQWVAAVARAPFLRVARQSKPAGGLSLARRVALLLVIAAALGFVGWLLWRAGLFGGG